MKKKIILMDSLPPVTEASAQPKEDEVTLAGRRFIGNQIAMHRRRLGLTQRELADRCGLAQSVIARIEQGRNSTGIDLLNRIALSLGCEVAIKKVKR